MKRTKMNKKGCRRWEGIRKTIRDLKEWEGMR